jgi:hypothetical protein
MAVQELKLEDVDSHFLHAKLGEKSSVCSLHCSIYED